MAKWNGSEWATNLHGIGARKRHSPCFCISAYLGLRSWKGDVMARSETGVEHLLRRAGFGASEDDLKAFENTSTSGVLDYLIDYERQADDVDSKIGDPAYAS